MFSAGKEYSLPAENYISPKRCGSPSRRISRIGLSTWVSNLFDGNFPLSAQRCRLNRVWQALTKVPTGPLRPGVLFVEKGLHEAMRTPAKDPESPARAEKYGENCRYIKSIYRIPYISRRTCRVISCVYGLCALSRIVCPDEDRSERYVRRRPEADRPVRPRSHRTDTSS